MGERSDGVCGGVVAWKASWEGEPRAWGGRAKKRWQNGSEHVLLLGCYDASDVIDGEECIISIMRGLGGNVNSLRIAGEDVIGKEVGSSPGSENFVWREREF